MREGRRGELLNVFCVKKAFIKVGNPYQDQKAKNIFVVNLARQNGEILCMLGQIIQILLMVRRHIGQL